MATLKTPLKCCKCDATAETIQIEGARPLCRKHTRESKELYQQSLRCEIQDERDFCDAPAKYVILNSRSGCLRACENHV